ncbi:hypothetical protein [Pseudomonas aeruginosa]|uniref:hypothetical protein n=1 Tax=Pseudomonas aeruginosa TaxID=287 RepID=UPI001F3508F3|nr:hypothetical protein [Pseudomonas aeruginosa]MCW0955829.1 hypothetical protein [Pseudomonas aeruginosa]MDD1799517.1 hypothetical protein [Pseudomonas aeruginosa]MDL5563295.1 hypothetical protein [Pseudomonas aeruginosa]MDS9721685.1 hypothetical protein [Pseudomonas aeruginosa]MEE2492084.1 hypothetical protein [Pseudomonas aeruginosa]
MSAIENQFVSIPETMGIEIAQLHDDGKRIGTRNMDHLVRIGSRLTIANQGAPLSPYDVPWRGLVALCSVYGNSHDSP